MSENNATNKQASASPESEERSPKRLQELSVWRMRLAFQVLSIASMVVLAAIVLVGIGLEVRSQLGQFFVQETVIVKAPDSGLSHNDVYVSLTSFVYDNPRLVEGIHLWGSYLLLFLMPLAGWTLWRLGKRLNNHVVFRGLGVGTIATSLLSLLLCIGSGKYSGQATFPELDLNNEDQVLTPQRGIDEEKAHQMHLYRAAPSMIVSILLLSIGAGLVSTRSMKESAGIRKKSKKTKKA